MRERSADRAVYFEFTTVGAWTKVTAIDADTGVEVSVTGPARAARSDLETLALRKLLRRLTQSDGPAK